MAKQLVGSFERHVEKAIVAIAGVVLIAVIAKYLVTSPNQLELGGEMGDPSTIDRKVADKAAEVRARIQDHRPVDETIEPLSPIFEDLLELKLATEDPISVAYAPAVPIIDPPEVIKGQKRLVEVVKFPKPAIVHGRSTLNLGDEETPRPIVDNWVTVSAVFDRKRQLALQKQQYGATQDEIIFGPVELQRRALRADGTWSDDDWEFVNVWPMADLPSPPAIRLVEKDGQIVVPGDDLDDLEGFVGELAFERLQVELLRPLMPDVINGDEWHFPEELMACRDLVLQDNEYLNPDAAAADDFEDRYGCMEAATSVEEVEVLTPRELIARKFKEGQKLMGKARKNWSPELAIDGYNAFADIVTNQSASGADKSKARKLMAECEQLMRDIERHGPDRGPGLDEEIERELLPAQQVWVHDAGHNSVESGKTYQYRMRLLLYNALAGEPTQFEAKQDATAVFVGGEWSEPSDPIVIGPDSLFFISGCDERRETVRVELYQWFDGVWVETRENFGVGATVGQTKRCPVPIPDSKEDDRPEVPFDAGVTVVDIDFDRPYRDRKTVGAGVSFVGSQASTCSAVFASGDGGLDERFVPTDKAHPVRKRVAKLVYRPSKR